MTETRIRIVLWTDSVGLRRFAGTTLMAGLLGIVFGGCGRSGDGIERFHVSGVVTHEGKPVPHGTILFTPDTSQGNSGPAGYSTIQDGSYDTAVSGKGTVGGPHIVVITGDDGQASYDEELGEEVATPLFPEFRTEVDLPRSATSVEFEVPASVTPRAPHRVRPGRS